MGGAIGAVLLCFLAVIIIVHKKRASKLPSLLLIKSYRKYDFGKPYTHLF